MTVKAKADYSSSPTDLSMNVTQLEFLLPPFLLTPKLMWYAVSLRTNVPIRI